MPFAIELFQLIQLVCIASNALRAACARDAQHNSPDRNRYPLPCNPGTHTSVLPKILGWALEPTRGTCICLLYGPAMSGKSAIAQSVSKHCEKREALAASFFFNHQDGSCSSTKQFVSTIAYQLMIAVPTVQGHICGALERDSTILDKHVEYQFRELIIKPLRSLPESDSPLVIVIDGLDECKDATQVSHLMALFSEFGPNSELQFPLHIFITSRPKPHIRAAFDLLGTDIPVLSFDLKGPNAWRKFRMIPRLLPPRVFMLTCLSLCIIVTLALLRAFVSYFFDKFYQFYTIAPACILSFVYHGIIFGTEYRRRWWGIRTLSTSSGIISFVGLALLTLVWTVPIAFICIDITSGDDIAGFQSNLPGDGPKKTVVTIRWVPWTLVCQLVLSIIELVVVLFIVAFSVLGRKLGRNHEYRAIQASRWRFMNDFP